MALFFAFSFEDRYMSVQQEQMQEKRKQYTEYYNIYSELQWQQVPLHSSKVKESCHGEYGLSKSNKKNQKSLCMNMFHQWKNVNLEKK